VAHLTLYDYRDLDLMLAANEIANEDGYFSTEDLAMRLGMEDDLRAVAMRLAWMRRYGVFTLDENRRLWRLTRAGERHIEAKQIAAASDSIEIVPDEALIDVMAHVTSRYRHGDAVTATLLRREFQFGTSPQSAAFRDGRPRRRRRR